MGGGDFFKIFSVGRLKQVILFKWEASYSNFGLNLDSWNLVNGRVLENAEGLPDEEIRGPLKTKYMQN